MAFGSETVVEATPRRKAWWEDLQDSLWFLPAALTLVAGIMALVTVWLDGELRLQETADSRIWLYGGGAEGARGVLAAITSSLITVTGTVFSITIVALQLASGQFSPRLLRRFTGDRQNQIVLGVFIGTFTYSMLVLRAVRSADDAGGAFVPVISVTVALALALLCIAGLILFVHHSARQIQAAIIIDDVAGETHHLVDTSFRDEPGADAAVDPRRSPPGEPQLIRSPWSGYLQDVDNDDLLRCVATAGATVRVLPGVGAFIIEGQPVFELWMSPRPDGASVEWLSERLLAALVVGEERTLHHDVTFGVRQLADIALKAMSPAINDPTTATHVVDRMGAILARAGRLTPPPRVLLAGDRPAVYLPNVTFEQILDIGFTQLRHYAAGDVVVMGHMLHTLRILRELVPATHHPAIARHARSIVAHLQANGSLDDEIALENASADWLPLETGTHPGRQ